MTAPGADCGIILAIVGSRGFNNYGRVVKIMKKIELVNTINAIVSGGAKGADQLGERYARENNIQCIVLKPDWKKYGKAAGKIRNTDIIDLADYVLIFWDGQSPGTKDTYEKTRKTSKKFKLILC